MAKRIAAFGEVMMRLQVLGYELLSQASSLNYSFSGTGVNVSSALARLGHTGYLISRLPANAVGDAAESYLRKLGITQSFIVRGGSYLGMYFLENGFGARPSRVTYSNRQESSFNTAPEHTYPITEIAKNIDIIHFCGITLAMNDGVRKQMKDLARAVKAQGGTVVFDCNYRLAHWGEDGYAKAKPHYEEMLELADIVMMNEKDAMFTLGMHTDQIESQEQLTDLIPAVAGQYQISVIAGTHRNINGDNTHSLRGFIYKDQSFTFSKLLTFSIYDRIGAGDAYTSGIVHGEIQGFSPEKTVGFAAAAGMLAHTIVGDTPMSSESEILRAMTEAVGDVER
ncbi:2-dehydro-3-deoxygluconokinase [Paenibacillus sp. V4I3]|uniref:sugar kinase n=1 Tax=unclassified Paenibacillus TaxID=185978 RepID=UPI0027871A99|nr:MULTISPECIES: sugar kinase [unclassified Paenibacillus]MDQ0874083.1 2-dehydro-3-deoxygluconokinase [Paenibacillus sp. V4I3]MDQ0890040.1 2-dehydro-3-deoxygluconokinase [Paenibacillus sp. V4I9]